MSDVITPKQKKVIEYMCEHLDASVVEVADATGVHTNSVYKWRKQQPFRDELDKELHNLFKDSAKLALDTMLNCVRNGDRQAAQYILDNTGFKVADKVELNTNDITIKINND